ncbi:S1C family serine protease [Clostridium estertheticum]|uniref:S1C family serine protease n=1 Tax=Clostridium estertheticum TaxID=238834 RepID=UPI001C6EB795|nr:trypsin-like peptidase domain-containing protein [Clostridium estertheticum]MBW9153401.1 trypsin-like peptidase domain-containing protein [Clostridium estertheticum]WLC84191.1 trypsin-like peptidase domain-containing protein [Clostridium estertheticum]
MDNKDNYKFNEEIRDALWKNAERGQDIFGEIKFRKNNKRNYFKMFLKVILFILIAALSGGITANYLISKDKLQENISGDLTQSKLEENNKDIYSNSISEVTRKVSPTVVGIIVNVKGVEETPEVSGSGIIFKSEGFIITNYHVIENATEIKVKLSNYKVLKAKVIGTDAISDLAVIKVEASNLPVAKLGDSSKVNVGDLAIAIGNPLGEQFSGVVTAGIVSALDRKINIVDKKTGEQTIYKVIQTDATINEGNSGGALCNINGEVIGINSLKIGSASETSGMGFAINTNVAKEIISDLMTYGKVIRPAIGIYGVAAISVGNNGIEGVYVQEVVSGSGAYKAGIMPTDIITQIGGVSVKNMEELSNILDKYKVAKNVHCKVQRNGKYKDISIILSELKATN